MKTLKHPFNTKNVEIQKIPFLHFFAPDFVSRQMGTDILNWFKQSDLWVPRQVKDFYEVADFNLEKSTIPTRYNFLKEPALVETLVNFVRPFHPEVNGKVDITAHRLANSEKIKIHTDHGELCQQFRIIIQFNEHWTINNGGLVMLFDSDEPAPDAASTRIYLPMHCSAWGFTISPHSYHAVSPVHNNTRYSLTYTFY